MEGYESVFYHIYNRGTDKRVIYNNDSDYLRFINGLKYFNESNKPGKSSDKFVDIISFCLMPNHFHLILRPAAENGITDFIRRLSTGYTMYFNKKYERKGVLFESKYKFKLIENEIYLLHLSRYVHLNPLSLVKLQWKNEGINDIEKANDFLKKYRWCSYSDYIGMDNFTGIADKSLLLNIVGGEKKYENFVKDGILKTVNDFDEMKGMEDD